MSNDVGSGNGLVLFMGESTEHAITSFQKYMPEVVYIVTSDKFQAIQKKARKLSKQYNFRKGEVCVVADLFEESAASTILSTLLMLQSRNRDAGSYFGLVSWNNWRNHEYGGYSGYTGLLIAMKVFLLSSHLREVNQWRIEILSSSLNYRGWAGCCIYQ